MTSKGQKHELKDDDCMFSKRSRTMGLVVHEWPGLGCPDIKYFKEK